MTKAKRNRWLGKLLWGLWCDSLKIVKGLLAVCLAVVILTIALWLTPYKYKIRPLASIRKAISQVVVFQSTPSLHLFSQYPNEYALQHPKGWIQNGEKLMITTSEKTLWLGVWNNEPITVRGVRFILFPPKTARPSKRDSWESAWLEAQFGHTQDAQYEYKESATIYSDSGWVIPAPIHFEFPDVGTYVFKYAVLAEDFGALKDHTFVVERTR